LLWRRCVWEFGTAGVRYDIISLSSGQRRVFIVPWWTMVGSPWSERVFGIPTHIAAQYRDWGWRRIRAVHGLRRNNSYDNHGRRDFVSDLFSSLDGQRRYYDNNSYVGGGGGTTLVDKDGDNNNLSVWSPWEYNNNNEEAKKKCAQ